MKRSLEPHANERKSKSNWRHPITARTIPEMAHVQPELLDVKQALSAIVAKVSKGAIANDDDSRDTYDALTEHFVDGGGDLSDLLLP